MSLMKWWSLMVVACGLVALLASVSALTSHEEEQLRESYAKLDQLLAESSGSRLDLEENMKIMNQGAEVSSSDKWTGRDAMSEARQRFARLTKLTTDEEMCFSRGYDIISETMRLTKGLTRLRQLVKQFVAENAAYCEPIFSSLSQRGIENGYISYARGAMVKLTWELNEQLLGWDRCETSNIIKKVLDGKQQPNINLYDLIRDKIRSHPKQVDLGEAMLRTMKELNVRNYTQYVEKYQAEKDNVQEDLFTSSMLRDVVLPCSLYVDFRDNDKRFQMASVHSRLLNRNINWAPDPKIPGSNTWSLMDFYRDWLRYEICQWVVLKDEQGVYKTIKELRAQVLKYDPNDEHPDSHKIEPVAIKFSGAEHYDEAKLFEANE